MNKKIDDGKYFLRKKIIIDFPMTAGEIFDQSLYQIKKLFIKNWINIRDNKIKLKNFALNKKVNKRKTFIKKKERWVGLSAYRTHPLKLKFFVLPFASLQRTRIL